MEETAIDEKRCRALFACMEIEYFVDKQKHYIGNQTNFFN